MRPFVRAVAAPGRSRLFAVTKSDASRIQSLGHRGAPEIRMLDTPRIQITLEPAIRQLREDFDLTSRELAQALGVDQRTVARWSAGDAFPRQGAKDRLEALAALDERLSEMFVSWEAARV